MMKALSFLKFKYTPLLFPVVMYLLITVLLTISWHVAAQQLQSDNGDGTYTNPVIFSDFPDPDVVRVGDSYYMVSTTMFVFPGVTLLKSNDLVNWVFFSNVVPRLDLGPCYNLDRCNRYGKGQWATSLQYNKGTFYVLFTTLDEGSVVYSSKDPKGPWQMNKLPGFFYDPGLFFDDNDKIFIAHGYSKLKITELDNNFVAKEDDVLVYTGTVRDGLEGSRVYKRNGYYYLYCTYGGPDGFQAALRSKNIYGPYQEKIVIRDNGNLNSGIHQGALVQTQKGAWWTIIFQDGGPFGRFPTLQPVNWIDDWPMVGVNGKGVHTYKKPDVGKQYPIKSLATSDQFKNAELGMQWGWNHNPNPRKWSLTEKKGHLRLYTAKVVADLTKARNSLTQRIFAYYSKTLPTSGITKLDISNMQDGDVAGLAVFQDPYAYIGVKKVADKQYVTMVNNGKTIYSIPVDQATIYLMAQPHYGNGKASFSYSYDNKTFTPLGNELQMEFNLSVFTGNKFMLFNYATKSLGGFVDFDWFNVDPSINIVTK